MKEAQEKYYQLKLDRIARRKKFWAALPDTIGYIIATALTVGAACLVIVALVGGGIYFFDNPHLDLTKLKAEVARVLEQQHTDQLALEDRVHKLEHPVPKPEPLYWGNGSFQFTNRMVVGTNW